jgi:hypothetical protein
MKPEIFSTENDVKYLMKLVVFFWCTASPSTVNEVFSLEFEQKPSNAAADYSLNLTLQTFELVYDQVCYFPNLWWPDILMRNTWLLVGVAEDAYAT